MRSQYLADGRSRLGSVLSVQAKRSNDVMVVAVKSSSGGGRCRCFFVGGDTSCVGGSHGLGGRVADTGAERSREPRVGFLSSSLVLCMVVLGLRLFLASLVLNVTVRDLLP